MRITYKLNRRTPARCQITANEVQKEYVARVVGVFPEWPVEANVPLLYDGKEGRSIVEVRIHIATWSISGGNGGPL